MTYTFNISTKGNTDIIDITSKVEDFVVSSEVEKGIAAISLAGSTVGLTVTENEEGVIEDLKKTIEKLVPEKGSYKHNRMGEGNAHAHLRSAIFRPFLTVPIEDNRLVLGTWQQILLLDFDNRPRQREVIITIIKG